MSIKTKIKQSSSLYQQLFAADIAVVRPEQEDVCSRIVIQQAFYYRSYVIENQEAIGYLAHQQWQKQGRGCVALIPLWEKRDDPQLVVLYVSIDNLIKLPLLELVSVRNNCLPQWYVSLTALVQMQLVERLNAYDPATEVVICGQVEDMSQMYPDEEMYQQIQQIEIFNFFEFERSIQDCYERFKGRACEFQMDE